MATKAIDPRILAALAAQEGAGPAQNDPRMAAKVQRARAQQLLQGQRPPPTSMLPPRIGGMKAGGKVKGSGAETKGKTRGRMC